MNGLLKISIAAGLPILLFSGGVDAGEAVQVNHVNSGMLMSDDDSDLLEFDEEGNVTNLGYPNVSNDSAKKDAVGSDSENVRRVVTNHLPRATVNPVRSGILISVDESNVLEFDEEYAVANLGYPNVSGGGAKSEAGWSVGYRKAFGSRWSLDTKYVRQNATSKPLRITVNPNDAEQAAQAISKALPKLAQGISVGLLHHTPIIGRLSTHFGGGAFIWRGERDTRIGSIRAIDKEDGVDPMLQYGLTYRLTPSIAVTGEAQRFFKTEDEDINRYSLGLVYSF